MLPGTRLEVQVFISCSRSDLGKAQGHGFFMWKPGIKQFLQFKYSDNLHSRRRDRTSLHFGSPWTRCLQTPLVIIQVGVLFSHQNTQTRFHFTALMSFGPVCHPGSSSHSLCKTSTTSATLLPSFYYCCPTYHSRYTTAPVWHCLNSNPSRKAFGTKVTKYN